MKTLTKTRTQKVNYLAHAKRMNVSKKYPDKMRAVNKYWMRDWMEQLNFLRIDPVALDLTESDHEYLQY